MDHYYVLIHKNVKLKDCVLYISLHLSFCDSIVVNSNLFHF